jgi:hypothetical protein
LTIACGSTVRLEPARRQVYVGAGIEDAPGRAIIRGYDASVACAQYVEYVNTWGRPTPPPTVPVPMPRAEGGTDKPALPAAPPPATYEATPAEQLVGVMQDVLGDFIGTGPSPWAVGDRILVRDSAEGHAGVREFLDLITADHGGLSAAAREEQAIVARLRKAKPPLGLTETPLTAALAQLCDAAEIDYVVEGSSVDAVEATTVNLELGADQSVYDALELALADTGGVWTVREGALCCSFESGLAQSYGYRVFETRELLKKIEAAVKRQRTAPGKRDGFTGELRDLGGVSVISDALEALVEIDSFRLLIQTWGTRVIVRGDHRALQQAETALKEMGWEPPKGN